jgi:hypothetical protein
MANLIRCRMWFCNEDRVYHGWKQRPGRPERPGLRLTACISVPLLGARSSVDPSTTPKAGWRGQVPGAAGAMAVTWWRGTGAGFTLVGAAA